jgi:hypothetical protein
MTEYLQQPVKQKLKSAWERQRQTENEGKVVQQLSASLTSVPRGPMTTCPLELQQLEQEQVHIQRDATPF